MFKKSELKPSPNDGRSGNEGGNGGGGRVSPHKNEALMLRPNEQLRDIFHPGNVRNIPRPKRKNGYHMCARYHSLGFCYNDCRASNGHGKLSDEEASDFKQFVEAARHARESYNQRRSEGGRFPQKETTRILTQNPTDKGQQTKPNTGTPP